MTPEPDHDKIIRLETQLAERQNALVLARELIKEEHLLFKENTEKHFEAVNNLQHKMDKMSETFATKKDLEHLTKLVYIGVGIAYALQFVFLILQVIAHSK